MTIHFAADHAGFELKQKLVAFIRDELGYEVIDHGADTYDEQDDYPEIISRAALRVNDAPGESKAVILGGSGQGEAIVANRFPHVRAIVYYGGPEEIITLSRQHNNANILSLGARFLDEESAKNAVRVWLNTEFSEEERHLRRIRYIEDVTP